MTNLITGFVFCLLSGAVCADTWTVDDDGAADFDNIQAAVNAASDGDEIIIMAGSYTSTGAQVVDTLGKAITLRGQSVDLTIIDGENVRRGVTCRLPINSNVIIENLWIRDGISDNGGGLWIEGNPEVKTCWIMNNDATSAGGNVYVLSGNPIFSAGCNFNNGTAPYGAGVYCRDGSPEFDTCFFLSNSASERGGAIRGYQISGYFSNCSFNNNTASRGGAGHFQANLNGLSSTFDTCYFQNNTASSLGGGVVNNSTTDSLFQSCSFVNNTATGLNGGQGSGGGLYNDSSNPQLLSCIFESNTANSNGGGVYNWSSAPQVQDCQFLNNSAATGGGIKSYNGTGPSITSSTFCENMPDNVSGVHVDDGTNCLAYSCADSNNNGTPDECEFSDVWTVDDDGLDYPGADFSNIQNAVDAASDGEEILVFPGTYTSNGNEVVNLLGKEVWLHSSEGAEATIIDGEYVRRGIFCNSGETSNTIIEGFMITNGNATSGAGMKCLNSSRPTILDCIFLNNTAVGQNGLGGGIYCHQYATPRIESCTFMNNHAGQGGGFYCFGVGEILINDCNFIGNSSLIKGGAISCEHTDISLELCSFQNNDGGDISFGYGGALSIWWNTATLIDCDFIGNEIENKGGAIDFWSLDAVMTNCTFENNSANYGAGINCGYSEITATNCSMSGNTALILGSGIYVYYSSVKFVDANEFDEIFVIDESEISFVADSICNVNGDVATSSAGKIRFDIDDLSAGGMLALSEAFTRQGGLGVTNNSSSLLQAIAGEIIPLAYSSNIYGSWDSIVLPTMSNGLGLQLIEYPAFRGGGDDGVELAVEVIEVEEVDFADPFTGNLDSPPIDIVAFDADGDGEDELAILFSGMSGFAGSSGGVVVFDISEDGDPVLIDGFSAIVGNNPVDIDAGDLNGDGLEDIIVANGESGTMSILLTTLQGDGSLSFTANTISGSNYFSTVAVIDWDNNDQLDAVVGTNVVDTDLLDGFQILLDVADGTSFGPFFEVPKFVLPTYQLVSDPPTCVHGGKKNSSWGFVGATRYGRVYRATLGGSLELLGELGGSNIATIEAIELDSLGGDGQIDLIVSSDEAEAIYLFQGNDSETDGFGDLIPLAVSEPVQDVLAIDADDDGDMDLVMAAPTSDTPLVLLRNDGGGTGLVGGLNGITWSKQEMNSGNPFSNIEPVDINDTKDLDKVIVGAGGATNLRGELAGTMEQTNILLGSDCDADLDGNGSVDIDDLLAFISAWGPCNGACPADFDGNGEVAIDDLLILISAWGPCN